MSANLCRALMMLAIVGATSPGSVSAQDENLAATQPSDTQTHEGASEATQTEATPPGARPDTSTPQNSANATEAVTAPDSATAATSQPASQPTEAGPGATFEYANTWDLNIEGGVGSTIDPGKVAGFGRIRGGMLAIRDNLHASIGLTLEVNSLAPITFGVQAELMHLEYGVWAQIGAMLDTKPRPGFQAAVGYSIVGFEMQYRDVGPQNGSGPYQVALFGKLRIPVRHIFKAIFGK